ncbi:MAG: Ppx/GppA family phosphatase [Deltaproteobacteria bacterium]|nr:Ppx/GppA family phosphatase [Deltaproteobacteria bacterium]
MATFAAVDIGSNSVRLKIARITRSGFATVLEDREVTRLGGSVFRTGILEPQAMEATIEALQRFHRAAQRHGAAAVRVVATSAMREARTARAFEDWVRSTTGWKVEIITGLEEGRLIHLGVMAGTRVARRALLIDLGGGSCELTFSVGGQIQEMASLTIGAVRLTEEFLAHDPPKPKELQRLHAYIEEEVARIEKRILARRVQATIATGGTAAALAALAAKRARRAERGSPMATAGELRRIADEVAGYDLEERRGLTGVGPRRAEIIIAGAAVYAGLMVRGIRGFRYSPLGLRDGLLAQMAADLGGERRIQQRIRLQRERALEDHGRHYGVDVRYARTVRKLAADLFAALRKVHQLPAEYGEWLAAAAMLQEVGSFVNRDGRHRHTSYLIANSELFGYTTEQRQIIATIARYVGKARPSADDRPMRELGGDDRELVPKAVMLLRLARALDQSRIGVVRSVRARVRGANVTLRISARRPGADLELWALEKEAEYFRAVFGRELVATSA